MTSVKKPRLKIVDFSGLTVAERKVGEVVKFGTGKRYRVMFINEKSRTVTLEPVNGKEDAT